MARPISNRRRAARPGRGASRADPGPDQPENDRAPFAGRLGIRQANLGQYLAAGAAIVTLQSIDPIFLNFTAARARVPRLKVGRRARHARGMLDQTFVGKITSLDAKVDEATRNLLVQATIDNKDGMLVPGRFARLVVELAEERKLVVVPETAVTFSLYGDSVYVVVPKKDKNGKIVADAEGKPPLMVERRFVRVASAATARRPGEGVKEDEQVVTSGQIRLRPTAGRHRRAQSARAAEGQAEAMSAAASQPEAPAPCAAPLPIPSSAARCWRRW